MPQQQEQPIKAFPMLAPLRGLKYNLGGPLIEDNQMTDCRNVSIDRYMNIAKLPGYALKGTSLPLTGAIMNIDQFYLSTGSEYLVVETTSNAYYLHSATSVWTDITGTARTGTTNNIIRSEIMNDLYISVNGVDPTQKWDAGASLAPLGGSPPVGNYIKKYKDYLLIANNVEGGIPYTQRVRWCDTGLPESWTPAPGSNAGYQDLTEGVDVITGMEILGNWLIVFKERSIYIGYLVTGIPGTQFEFDIQVEGTGCIAGSTIEPVKNLVFFLGADNVYSFDGLNVAGIGDDIKDELFSIINPATMHASHAQLIEELDEYHLFIPTGSNTYPDTEFIYNYNTRSWTRGNKPDITKTGFYTKQTGTEWIDGVGTWLDQVLKWGDRQLLAAAPTNLYGDANGYVYEQDYSLVNLNGSAVDAWFSTRDFTLGVWDRMKFWCRLDIYAIGHAVAIYYSIDEGANWTLIDTLTLHASLYTRQKVDFRVVSEKIRFKFENAVVSETFKLRNFTLYAGQEGRL